MAGPVYPSAEDERRFLELVDVRGRDRCWLWKGTVNGNKRDSGGYGLFTVAGKPVLAHRLAYEIAYGPMEMVMRPDWDVAHHCGERDNRLCVNHHHLILESKSDNGRRRNSHKPHVRLSDDEVVEILHEFYLGPPTSCEALADRYGTHSATIWSVVIGKTHKETAREFEEVFGVKVGKLTDPITGRKVSCAG